MSMNISKNHQPVKNNEPVEKPVDSLGNKETMPDLQKDIPRQPQYVAGQATRSPKIEQSIKETDSHSLSPSSIGNNTAQNLALSKTALNGTEVQKNLVYFMEGYLSKMGGVGKLNPKVGAKIQYDFWKTILATIRNCDVKDFKMTWNVLLVYFNENYDGVLKEELVLRFPEEWVGSREEAKAFANIVMLCSVTRNYATRKENLRFFRLDKALSVFFNESDKQKLLNFYS